MRRRGGYCFVLVDAFAALLTSLGFVVSLHTAGVGESPLAAEKWGNHIVLLVHLGERRFVSDVSAKGRRVRCAATASLHGAGGE